MDEDATNSPGDISISKRSEAAVVDWRDRYQARIDHELCAAFPQLAQTLEQRVGEKFRNIVFSKNYSFTDDVIQPELAAWIGRHVPRILEEAKAEFAPVPFEGSHSFKDAFAMRAREVAVSPTGLLLGAGGAIALGLVFGIGTTGWWFLKKPEIHWLPLIASIVVGVVLTGFGAAKIVLSRRKVLDTFRCTCLPKLRESVIGDGIQDSAGEHSPSLRQKLQKAVHAAAATHLDSQS